MKSQHERLLEIIAETKSRTGLGEQWPSPFPDDAEDEERVHLVSRREGGWWIFRRSVVHAVITFTHHAEDRDRIRQLRYICLKPETPGLVGQLDRLQHIGIPKVDRHIFGSYDRSPSGITVTGFPEPVA